MPNGRNFDDFLKEQRIYEQCTDAALKSRLTTAPFDVADYLGDEETIAAYFAAVRAGGTTGMYLQAVKDVARARSK
jgi:hypothetical protein